MRWFIVALLLSISIVCVAALIAGCSTGPTTVTVSPSSAARSAETALSKAKKAVDAPAKVASTIGNGTWRVPQDVKPGTYKTDGASEYGCYWARLKGLSGDFGDIITNDNTDGPASVTIKTTDRGFESLGCKIWERVS